MKSDRIQGTSNILSLPNLSDRTVRTDICRARQQVFSIWHSSIVFETRQFPHTVRKIGPKEPTEADLTRTRAFIRIEIQAAPPTQRGGLRVRARSKYFVNKDSLHVECLKWSRMYIIEFRTFRWCKICFSYIQYTGQKGFCHSEARSDGFNFCFQLKAYICKNLYNVLSSEISTSSAPCHLVCFGDIPDSSYFCDFKVCGRYTGHQGKH